MNKREKLMQLLLDFHLAGWRARLLPFKNSILKDEFERLINLTHYNEIINEICNE